MTVWSITDQDGKVFGVAAHKSIAVEYVRTTWPYSGGYRISTIYEMPNEIKMVIREPARIGENPNETLVLINIWIRPHEVINQL